MTQAERQAIRDKFGGLCAYTGRPLGDRWQVDHAIPRHRTLQSFHPIRHHDDPDNLLPACWEVNHYKSAFTVDEFRDYMATFHLRLAKLPKRTSRPQTVRRIAYMNRIAELFGITPDGPFNGKFYFETV